MRPFRTLPFLAIGAVLGVVVAQEPAEKKPATASLEEMMKPPAPVEDAFLDWLVGTWSGKTTFMGQEFEGTATYSWALGHQFLKSVEKQRSAKGDYEGEGYTRPEGGEYVMWWFDNHGSASTARGKKTGDTFVMSGTDPNFGPFRGTMKKTGPDEMTWLSEGGPDAEGKYTMMGEGTLRRVKK